MLGIIKDELLNTGKLTALQLKNTGNGRPWLLIAFGFLFLGSMLPFVITISRPIGSLSDYYAPDYAEPIAIGLAFTIIMMTLMFKNSNSKLSMYPQTRTSRFLAEKARYYVLILVVGVGTLVFYLFEHALLALLDLVGANIILVYRFDIEFVVAGFLVGVLYMALVTETVLALRTLISKFKLISVTIIILHTGLFILNPMEFNTFFFDLISQRSLTLENNLGMFLMKGFLLWVMLFILSLIVNAITDYAQNTTYVNKTALAVIAVATLILVPYFHNQSLDQNSFNLYEFSSPYDLINDDYINKYYLQNPDHVITIDASCLPPGTKIHISATNIAEIGYMDQHYAGPVMDMMYYYILDEQALADFPGGQIVIVYSLPSCEYNTTNMTAVVQPGFSAHLEGQTLFLEYHYVRNTKIVYLPMWSYMKQFSAYEGKGLLREGGGIMSWRDGIIIIDVKE
ncbi:MAG: hypothetical protein FWG40_07175 [Peptococcaceae bacterium]|nr:hypothetical protein [Peptococcaceae bacterium]